MCAKHARTSLSDTGTTAKMAGLDPDAFTRCYQLTRSMYRDVYPALDPSEPALSAKGKTVLITGAGGTVPSVRARPEHDLDTSIDRSPQAVALAWAKAGATTVVLIGRTLKSLEDIANKIRIRYEAIRTIVITTDTTNEVEVANLFSTLQQQHDIRLDVLVQGAGAMNNAGSVEKVPNEWWQDFVSCVTAALGGLTSFAHTIFASGSQCKRTLPDELLLSATPAGQHRHGHSLGLHGTYR
jgi:hypothetical protein